MDIEKSVVPWYSMQEWHEVYELIYSDDPAHQGKGYEKLLVWKARCPNLVSGVECTLNLFQARLHDQRMKSQILSGDLPVYGDNELRMMYSTAISRFLNHLYHLSNLNDLYSIGMHFEIPKWVVELRHQASHNATLPALDVLRKGAEFALDWLHHNYWKIEAKSSEDWIITEHDLPENQLISAFEDIIEKWLALKIYEISGYELIKDIPDKELKEYFQQEFRRSGAFYKQGSKSSDQELSLSIQSAQNLLLKKIRSNLKTSQHVQNNVDLLLKVLMMEEVGLLPSQNIMESLNLFGEKKENQYETQKLYKGVLMMWQNIVNIIHEVNGLHKLISLLLDITVTQEEIQHRSHLAALWIKEICCGLSKLREGLKVRKQLLKSRKLETTRWKRSVGAFVRARLNRKLNFGVSKLKEKKVKKLVYKEVEKSNPGLTNVLGLSLCAMPLNDSILSLVKQAILNPTRWTTVFLPDMLNLLQPPLPENMRSNLELLVKIYFNEMTIGEDKFESEPIFTLSSLLQNDGVDDMEVDSGDVSTPNALDGGDTTKSLPTNDKSSTWTICEDYADWSIAPVGMLPWQRDHQVLKCDLPKVQWKTAKPVTECTSANSPLVHKMVSKVVDWAKFTKFTRGDNQHEISK